jgi:AcrR family transcriptional regulator
MAKQTKSVTNANGKAAPRSRNAARSRKAILQSALEEFSTKGYSGARIDEIAKRAAVSKPLIYEYFGDKDAIYEAALRETYVQIREGEKTLDMDELSPEDAIRSLVVFTMDHFRRNPWFISMLNTENLRGGSTVRQMQDAGEIQSNLISKIADILEKGEIEGQFRSGIDAVELYIFIASLCYFPISNMHTLRSVFQCTVDDEWLERRGLEAAEMIVCYLKEANK